MNYEEAITRANEYAKRKGLNLGATLGFGQEGYVLATDVHTVVKSFKLETFYANELAIYERLSERHVREVCGFSVPALIDHHDGLLVIEIEFVSPPFVLDFASAKLDHNPLTGYEPEIIADTFAAWEELFEDDWAKVKRVFFALRLYGVFLVDLNTNNVRVKPFAKLPPMLPDSPPLLG